MDLSPLQRLPGELRNRIYEFALFQSDDVTINISKGIPQLHGDTNVKHTLALTTTCKQLRYEASPIFYEVNKFTLLSKQVGEPYSGDIRDDHNIQWQKGLRTWLDQIREQNRAALHHVEIDIGTSFMYNYVPSSENVWRSVTGVLSQFDKNTRVNMKTELDWTYESRRAFALSIQLSDPMAARKAVNEVMEEQRRELMPWCRSNHAGSRRATYMTVELETCAQELESFVSLLEIMSLNAMC